MNVGDYVTLKYSRGQPKMRIMGVALRRACGEMMFACNFVDPQTKMITRGDFALRSLIPWDERRRTRKESP